MIYDAPVPSVLRQKLTRACNGCVKAKRKCSFEFPKCARCAKRNIACNYRNEPLNGTKYPSKQDSTNCFHLVPVQSTPTFASIHLREPLRPVAVDSRTFAFLNDQLKDHVSSFIRSGTTTFIHRSAPQSSLLRGFRSLMTEFGSVETLAHADSTANIEQVYVLLLEQAANALARALPSLRGYQDVLPFLQALILFHILCRCVIPLNLLPTQLQQAIKQWFHIFRRTTFMLWNSAPVHLPAHLSMHEAFALAESIRRTLIMSREVQAHCSIYNQGYFEPELFAACLPFDRRLELWHATTAEFDEIIASSGDKVNGSEHMISYLEFCELFDSKEVTSMDDQFGTMIWVGAKGLDSMEYKSRPQVK